VNLVPRSKPVSWVHYSTSFINYRVLKLFFLFIAFTKSYSCPCTDPISLTTLLCCWEVQVLCRVIQNPLRYFRTTKTDTAEWNILIGTESVQVCLGNRRHGVLADFTARGQSWRNMAWTGDKKSFCVLEFAKTESIVPVQLWFRIMYHTESPTDKTIREWYMKFQQSACVCAVKRTGRPRPSVELSSVWELLWGLTKGGHVGHL
jgi:hypothetical protein